MSDQNSVARILAEAIRQRLTKPTGRFYAVRAIEDGLVRTQVVVADSVGMPQTGHLIFATQDQVTKESRAIRIFAPNTWFGMRDLTAEGPEAVAAFLASLEGDGVGTA